MGCPRVGAVPRPLGGTDLGGALPRALGTPVAAAAEGSGTLTVCAGGRPGRLAWRGSAVGKAAGPSAPGSASARSHSVVRVLQIRKLTHKEIKSKRLSHLPEVAQLGRRGGGIRTPAPMHSEAKRLHWVLEASPRDIHFCHLALSVYQALCNESRNAF